MSTSRSRHLVDPQLGGFLDILPVGELNDDTLAEMRTRSFPMPVDPEAAARIEASSRMVPGLAGAPDVELLIYRPRGSEGLLPGVFHIHGGGFVAGNAREIEALLISTAAELGCIVTSVNYRLAPETRFPGAIEDCYAALGWVFKNAPELGLDTARIGLRGESAGGGLAASLALLARDRGEYKLAFQSLIYPMLDDRTCIADPNPFSGEFLWTPPKNTYGWRALLGVEPGSDGVSPYAAAARAEDLTGLPPTYIGTTALDLFVDENLEYARRLIRAGVPCEFHLYPGGFHGFDVAPGVAISEAARQASAAALRRFLFPA